jgi:hypothetical protein
MINIKNNKCIACSEYKNCSDSFKAWIFFIIGLIATVSVRLVSLFMDYNVIYAKMAWYAGVIGFFIFFLYKFRVEANRAKLIIEKNLMIKIRDNKQLEKDDYGLVGSILCGLSSNKDRINYIFIFGSSILALLFAIYMDFLKR